MDALCLRARNHLMNRHSAKATFAPQVRPDASCKAAKPGEPVPF